jgi:mono/diheme cytochrome c family protein
MHLWFGLLICLSFGAGPLSAQSSLLGQPAAARPENPERPRLRAAAEFYRQHCQRCHDSDGSGSASRGSLPDLPDFTSGPWHRQHTDGQLAVSIMDGKGTRMPSFAGSINQRRAEELVAFIRRFGPASASSAMDASGDFEKRFRELEAELQELKRQFRTLSSSGPGRKQ